MSETQRMIDSMTFSGTGSTLSLKEINVLPSDYACPRCECKACYALHRKGLDWILSSIGLRPARCLTCNNRFYARYSIPSKPQEQIGTPAPSQTHSGNAGKGTSSPRGNAYSRRGSRSRKTA